MNEIKEALFPEQLDIVIALLPEYQQWLGFDLSYQCFDEELSTLPGKYASPRGALLLAYVDSSPAGMIAMRPVDQNICEMKRLYVRPSARGLGLGCKLIERIFDKARAAGYSRMRLDTVAGKMDSAIALYRQFGFNEIPPYYSSPVVHTTFFEKQL